MALTYPVRQIGGGENVKQLEWPYLPGSHGKQAASLMACKEGEYVFSGHGSGFVEPGGQ